MRDRYEMLDTEWTYLAKQGETLFGNTLIAP